MGLFNRRMTKARLTMEGKLTSLVEISQMELLMRADEMEADRTQACADLRARMARNEVYCRQSLAETAKLNTRIETGMSLLERRVDIADSTLANFKELRRNQSAQELLDKHKGAWSNAIRTWLEQGFKVEAADDEDSPDTMALAQLLAEHFAMGEKSMEQSFAVILYHPRSPIDQALKVAYATGPQVKYTTGQSVRRFWPDGSQQATEFDEEVWDVLLTGNPVISFALLATYLLRVRARRGEHGGVRPLHSRRARYTAAPARFAPAPARFVIPPAAAWCGVQRCGAVRLTWWLALCNAAGASKPVQPSGDF